MCFSPFGAFLCTESAHLKTERIRRPRTRRADYLTHTYSRRSYTRYVFIRRRNPSRNGGEPIAQASHRQKQQAFAYCLVPRLLSQSLTAQSIHAISSSRDKNSSHSFAISLAWYMRLRRELLKLHLFEAFLYTVSTLSKTELEPQGGEHMSAELDD